MMGSDPQRGGSKPGPSLGVIVGALFLLGGGAAVGLCGLVITAGVVSQSEQESWAPMRRSLTGRAG